MRCATHPWKEAKGYCSVCGAFGCEDCIHEHEGALYCRKHYRPIAQKLEEERKQQEVRKRYDRKRQRLVVRYKDKRRERGVCFALNPKESGFHLDLVDNEGVPQNKSVSVEFRELKAVFFVKSFDGNIDSHAVSPEWQPEGKEIVVKFTDGEVIRGFSLRAYRDEDERFYVIPADPRSNNISVLVERSAVEQVYTPEEYEQERLEKAREQYKAGAAEDLSQEETMADFQFQSKHYEAALKLYQQALKTHPQSHRIRKKMLVSQYNVGVQHIKRREYDKALAYMDEVLRLDPQNPHAMKKAMQLRRIMEKMKRAKGT